MRTIQSALLLLFCLIACSCNPFTKAMPSESITGNWLIIFPDHRLKTVQEREVYGKHQDSIITLYGLKLISLTADGTFIEMDSIINQRGKWTFTKDSVLRIQEGGKGFNPFTTSFKNFDNDTLQLIQDLPLDGEKIKVVWFCKKIEDGSDANQLFEADYNNWRRKPTVSEPEKVMRKRLAKMLAYYAAYFSLVSKEATYFTSSRVPLPFNYYQHSMGLNSELTAAFKNLFYNEADVKKAYAILRQAIRSSDIASTGDNYVIEYAAFLKKMGEFLEK